MTFEELLAQVVEGLQQDVRVSYLALKRQFDLDDDSLESGAIDLIRYDINVFTLNLEFPTGA